MKHFYALAVFCILLTSTTFSQSIGGGITLGFPRGEFKNEVARTAIGGQINFLIFESPISPFSAGINFGFYNYGSESRNEPWSSTIPDVYLNVDRSSNLLHFNVLFRVQPKDMDFRPYMDLAFGGAYAYTETKVTSEHKTEEPIATSTNLDDFMWCYGAGAGLQYKIAGESSAENKGVGGIYLDLNVRYMATSPAKYLKEGGIEKINDPYNPRVKLHVTESRMDLLTVTLGVQVQFDWNSALRNMDK